MLADLISIETDTVPLDGLMYEPVDREPIGCVQLLHGNAMNFYTGPLRFVPERLVGAGFSCLAYNRRGHDTLSTRNSRVPVGNAFQTASQAVDDNRFAARWLVKKGYPDPIVLGHSNGGMLAVRHVADHPGTPALVLMSAHRGGLRMAETASGHGLLAMDQMSRITEEAESLVEEGFGDRLMLLPGWWHCTTASSWMDLLTNTPDVLELAPEIACPTLYLRGDEEPSDLYPAEEFDERSGGPVDVMVLERCDHFYNGVESESAEIILDWILRTLPAT